MRKVVPLALLVLLVGCPLLILQPIPGISLNKQGPCLVFFCQIQGYAVFTCNQVRSSLFHCSKTIYNSTSKVQVYMLTKCIC